MTANPPARSLALAMLALAGCGGPPAELDVEIVASAWPEADALFHRDVRWRGADAAYSVPLGDDRILWLFGDSFVSTTDAHLRRESRFARNTIAVQTGADPTTADITFHWRGTSAEPTSFFAEDGDRWHWPLHGLVVDGTLVVFLTRLAPTPGVGFGFEAEGYRVAIIDDPSGPADAWDVRIVEPTGAPPGLIPGAALNLVDDHVVTLAVREPGDHAGFLARWTRAQFQQGELNAMEWWADGRWTPAAELTALPTIVLRDAAPESSLHFDASLGRWVHVRSLGFGGTTIGVEMADEITGPWTSVESVFRPPESDRPMAFVYAGKGHPELTGADLVVTYAANTLDEFSVLLDDETLYYPRFVRLDWVTRPRSP